MPRSGNRFARMTMDDNSSVYVGGLAFDSSEAMLRSVFEAYGDILAIKVCFATSSTHCSVTPENGENICPPDCRSSTTKNQGSPEGLAL